MNVLGVVWAKVLQLIDIAAKLVVVGVPVLYFMGWIYLETYWKKLGVSDGLLGLTTTDYLRAGAMVLLMSIAKASGWILIFALACAVVITLLVAARVIFLPKLFAVNRKLQAVQAVQRREARRRVSPKHRRLANRLDAGADTLAAGAMALLVSFMFLLGLIVVGIKPSQMAAEEQADKLLKAIAKLSSEDGDWLIAHLEAAVGRPALVVQCGGETCVLLADDRMEVWPRASINRMETCRRVEKSDDGTFHCAARTALL